MNEITQIRIPYYITFYAALLALVAVSILSWRNREGKGVKVFIASALLELSWLVGYLLELASSSLNAKIFWDKFQYIGALFTPVTLLIFALQFTNRKFNLKRLSFSLLGIAGVLQLIIFADLWPELLYVSPRIEVGVPWDELRYEFGFITNISNYYVQILALVYIGILISGFFKKNIQRAQLTIVMLGTAIPTIGVILAFGFGWKFANQRDVSPLMFAFSSMVIAWGIFRMGLFNVVPIAREILFNNMSNLLIILDRNDRVIDTNPAARHAFGNLDKEELIGTHISLLQPELYQKFGKTTEVHTEINVTGQTFDFNVTPLYNKRGELMGRLVNANDITEQKQVEDVLYEINLENELRAKRLNAIADVSQAISQIRDLETLLPVITRQISEKFDFYHAGIFLFSNDRKFAELIAANSDGGKRMLERKHRLEIGQVGVVGRVAQDGTPRVALDVGQDAVYFDNPDLPETHSEMALPLRIGSEIIGVLDVQSKRKNAFSEEDTDVFISLANQVAIAIDNARQVEATQSALEEARSLTQEYVREAWTALVRSQQAQLGYRFVNDVLLPIQEAPAEEASQQTYEYPVQLRGEIIGVIKVRMAKEEAMKMTENDKVLLESISERAGLALESARLLEDAQRRASRESVISQFSTTLSNISQTDRLMSVAVSELQKILDATEVSFELDDIEGAGA